MFLTVLQMGSARSRHQLTLCPAAQMVPYMSTSCRKGIGLMQSLPANIMVGIRFIVSDIQTKVYGPFKIVGQIHK